MYGATMAVFLVLYLLDFSYWQGLVGSMMRRLGVSILLTFLCGSGLATMAYFPVLPLALFLLLLPVTALFLRHSIYRLNTSVDVAYYVGINFISAGCLVLLVWLLWLFGDCRLAPTPLHRRHAAATPPPRRRPHRLTSAPCTGLTRRHAATCTLHATASLPHADGLLYAAQNSLSQACGRRHTITGSRTEPSSPSTRCAMLTTTAVLGRPSRCA